METVASAGLAALFGAASVILFSYGWMSILGMFATGILYGRGRILIGRCLTRIVTDLTRSLVSGLTLAVCFRFYLVVLGRGQSQGEQLAYLAGCLPVLFVFLAGVSRRIDRLFDPQRN